MKITAHKMSVVIKDFPVINYLITAFGEYQIEGKAVDLLEKGLGTPAFADDAIIEAYRNTLRSMSKEEKAVRDDANKLADLLSEIDGILHTHNLCLKDLSFK